MCLCVLIFIAWCHIVALCCGETAVWGGGGGGGRWLMGRVEGREEGRGRGCMQSNREQVESLKDRHLTEMYSR